MKTIYSLISLIITTILLGQANTSYSYDDLDRLKTIQYPNGNKTVYEYDALGNRISKQIITNASDYFLSELEGPLATNYGQTLEVVLNADYSGTFAQAELDEVRIAFYLSADCEWSDEDVMLTTAITYLGYDYPEEIVSTEVVIEDTVAEGTYNLLVFIDYENVVEETDEDNNILCTELTITSENIYYVDMDGDGFGNASNFTISNTQPVGYVLDNTDCDDTRANVNPQATEIPNNGIDENCDGTDESLPDSDGDGVPDTNDNCPNIANADQADLDNDDIGDVCDDDIDGDGILNNDDSCPYVEGEVGYSCDDGDADTINDVITANCECQGVPPVVEDCPAPTNISIIRDSATQVSISTDVPVWDMYVDIINNPPTSASNPKSHWNDLKATHVNPRVNPNWTYYLWFRTQCDGATSEYIGPYLVEPLPVARVFPNPTSSTLNIAGINAQSIKVFDSYGNFLFSTVVHNNVIDLSLLQTGAYTIEIMDINNQVFTERVIKR